MDSKDMRDFDDELSGLFQEYRRLHPDPEPGPNFMPALWRRIEAKQTVSLSFRRWAQGFVTAAAALCLLMMLYLSVPAGSVSPVYTSTYLDVLYEEQSPEQLAYALASFDETPAEGSIR
jgi:hypothetical protein